MSPAQEVQGERKGREVQRLRVFVLAAVALAVLAAPASSGVYYEARTTGEGKGSEFQAATVKAWVSGDKAKIFFETTGNPMMKPGDYLLAFGGGQTLYLVSPKDKTYTKWDMDAMMQMAAGFTKMMKMEIHDAKVEKLEEKPGEAIAGLPTIYYKFRTTYRQTMKFMMMSQDNRVEEVRELWVAPDLVEKALGVYLRKTPPKTVGYQPAGLAGGGHKARPAVGVLHGIQDHQDFIQKPLDLRRASGGQVVGQSQRCFPAGSFVAVHRAHQPNHQRQISRQGLVSRGLKPRIGKGPELGSELLHARYVFRLAHHQEQKLAPLERGGVGDELHPIGSGLGQTFSVPLNLQWIADLLTPVVTQHLLDRGDGGIQASRGQNLQAAGYRHRCP